VDPDLDPLWIHHFGRRLLLASLVGLVCFGVLMAIWPVRFDASLQTSERRKP
jgi:hypothetical protein